MANFTQPTEEGLLFGNTVMSRWAVEASETYVLECADPRPKLLRYARTGGVDVFCAHLTSDPRARWRVSGRCCSSTT